MKTICAFIVLFFGQLLMAQQNEPKPNQLSVVGNVEVKEIADQVSLSFSIKGTGSTLRNAVENADAQTQNLNQILIQLGVKPRNIFTSGFYSGANYGDEALFSSSRDYKASITTVIKIDSIALLEPVLFSICEEGVEHLSQLTFSLKDEANVRRHARIDATLKAKEKAEDIAKALGVTLGKVLDVQEVQQTQVQPLRAVSYLNPSNPFIRNNSINATAEKTDFIDARGEGFNAQTILVTSQVSVIYEIK